MDMCEIILKSPLHEVNPWQRAATDYLEATSVSIKALSPPSLVTLSFKATYECDRPYPIIVRGLHEFVDH